MARLPDCSWLWSSPWPPSRSGPTALDAVSLLAATFDSSLPLPADERLLRLDFHRCQELRRHLVKPREQVDPCDRPGRIVLGERIVDILQGMLARVQGIDVSEHRL